MLEISVFAASPEVAVQELQVVWDRVKMDCLESGEPVPLAPRLSQFAVSVPGLPECHFQGVTEQEAPENIADTIREYLLVVQELNRGKLIREVEIAA